LREQHAQRQQAQPVDHGEVQGAFEAAERGRPGAAAFERLVRQTDLEMLAVVGGRERTAAEYETLLAEAGFALSRIAPMAGMPWSVIEAQPV